MKRKMAMALAAVLVAGSLPVTVSAATFTDINEVTWASSTIQAVSDKGLINGYEDGTFRAKNNVTYSEAMVMVYNLMSKTGNLKTSATNTLSIYQSVLNTYKIPTWSQSTVAYGLSAQILMAADLPKFTTNGVSNPATRQDVAVMFGRALSEKYDIYAGTGVNYNDVWRISDEAMPYVDLLTRLGIVTGDDSGNFNPTANITRAEMAVMMNKTYDLLSNELANTGEITEIVNHDGDYYDVDVKMDNGERNRLTLSDDNISVYNKDGSRELPISSLTKGDRVSLVFDGLVITKIYLLDEEASAQEKYDAVGYIYSLKDGYLNLESENTGETTKYKINTNCTYYLDGKKTTESAIKDVIDDNSDKYVYAGLYTETKNEKVDGERQDVLYANAVYVTVKDEYTQTGEVTDFTSTTVYYKASGSNARKSADFASDCEFYIGDKKSSAKDLEEMAESGTVYVKVTVNSKGKATKIVMTEDKFTDNTASSTYTVKGFNKDRIIVSRGGTSTTYEFGSTSDITFYIWEGKWNEVSFKGAESFYDEDDLEDGQKPYDTMYARMNFDKSGKITAIYMVKDGDRENAFGEAEETERKGTVEYIKDGKLKFKTSSTEYTLQSKYDEDSLEIGGAPTSSLTVLTRMANCDDVTLYAEIKADGNNKITDIEARLTAAEGKMIEYNGKDASDSDKKNTLTLETSDGSQFKLKTVSNPKTDSDDYDAEDLQTTGYRGSSVELEFNNDGEISKIIVTDSSYNSGTKRVKGTASLDGSKIKIDGKSYSWDSKTYITSSSFTYSTKDMFERMLQDKDIEVYVEATISDSNKVERINARVESAEGEFVEYDSGSVVIETDSRKWSFNTVSKNTLLKNCGLDDEKDFEKKEGKNVTLEFNSDGLVEEF
ncbi:S-layer homology domain-containing protein [Anaerotignum lactatifermentans]|uniref:S-layer homology domain-containing protein n=1 Tax=Anaerotignum lactatifermentans TaxID=160404 RepID=UPI0018746797|nr:S-layer homology domain-containing protein [Anaerotignum lactatifermentans]MBE5075755.1 S-layer homology domain-containing protein [Anaerotignum lactatifermentans]